MTTSPGSPRKRPLFRTSHVPSARSKVRFVPGYCATLPFAKGIRRTLAWFDADPARKQIDDQANAAWDRLIEAYENGTREALRRFRE